MDSSPTSTRRSLGRSRRGFDPNPSPVGTPVDGARAMPVGRRRTRQNSIALARSQSTLPGSPFARKSIMVGSNKLPGTVEQLLGDGSGFLDADELDADVAYRLERVLKKCPRQQTVLQPHHILSLAATI